MTLKAHPDKEGGSEEKMAALNEAYEVLSNPGMSLFPHMSFVAQLSTLIFRLPQSFVSASTMVKTRTIPTRRTKVILSSREVTPSAEDILSKASSSRVEGSRAVVVSSKVIPSSGGVRLSCHERGRFARLWPGGGSRDRSRRREARGENTRRTARRYPIVAD